VTISKRTLKLALFAASLLVTGTAAANSVGLNFVDNGNGGIQNGATDALGATDVAGAPAYQRSNWNNLGRWGQTVSLIDNSGASTSITATWDSNNTWRTGAGSSSPDHKLMHGYLDSTGQANVNGSPYQFWWNENKPEVYLTGISSWLAGQAGATQYDIVLYTDGDTTGGRIGEYWLQDGSSGDPPTALGSDLTTHVFVKDSANFSGTYTQVPLSSNSVAGAVSGNYVVFAGLSANSFILRSEEQTFRAQINGIQIVPITAALRPGDVDGDDDVDLIDFALIRDHFETAVGSRRLGDVNEDGYVDLLDFRVWKTNYPFPAAGAGSGANTSVPEPACWSLVFAASVTAWSRRRRMRSGAA
jgi:hypothetical protein